MRNCKRVAALGTTALKLQNAFVLVIGQSAESITGEDFWRSVKQFDSEVRQNSAKMGP